MAQYLKVNGQEYPAKFISKYQDLNWDKRETQTIYLTMSHDAVAALLPDNTPWSIVQRETVDVLDEQGKPTGETKEVVNEYDNSEYSIAGDITDHRNGTVSIKMGKPTETATAAANGLYYKDPEDTKLYLCERIGEAAGGKIVLQYLPHELIGNYFEAV